MLYCMYRHLDLEEKATTVGHRRSCRMGLMRSASFRASSMRSARLLGFGFRKSGAIRLLKARYASFLDLTATFGIISGPFSLVITTKVS